MEDDSLIPVADFTERQRLKQIEDHVLDLMNLLDSTQDVLDSLIRYYRSWQTQEGATKSEDLITALLQEKREEILLLHKKVGALRSKVSGTTELVSG